MSESLEHVEDADSLKHDRAMHNRPVNQFDLGSVVTSTMQSWDVDRRPVYRLAWLVALLVLPLGAVVVRLVQLQVFGREALTEVEEILTTSYEQLPSTTGRIVAFDGTVLAQDDERFTLMMHYRWLEEPPDSRWLRHQAIFRLSRSERRNRDRIEVERQRVLALRCAMWNRLATRLGISLDTLAERRGRIQRRVERIAASVENRRRNENGEEPPAGTAAIPDKTRAKTVWQTVFQTVFAALTTPPQRDALDPVVVQEELAYHPLAEEVPLETVIAIETHPEQYPGLRYRVTHRRIYPQGTLAAHTIGYRTPLDATESDEQPTSPDVRSMSGEETEETIGRTGVERSYERSLQGVKGLRKLTQNRRGEIVCDEIVRRPKPGRDVELTLHVALQQQAERILDDVVPPTPIASESTEEMPSAADSSGPTGGCIVVLDVKTGAVRAAAAAPRFDVNLLDHPDPVVWRRLTSDTRHPFLPRLTHLQLPPGSVFKPLTAVAILETGLTDPDQPFHCRGYLDEPDSHRCLIYRRHGVGHGDVTLEDALCRSCNVYFFTAARRLGPQPLVEWAERFGFGHATGVDLPGEYAGVLPCPPARHDGKQSDAIVQAVFSPFDEDGRRASDRLKQTRARSPWYPGDTLGLAIGQSRLAVTPLQIVRMMAAIANGGYLVTPHVVCRVHSASANELAIGDGAALTDDLAPPDENVSPAPIRIRGLSRSTLQRVRSGLEKVVSHPHGTGHRTVYLENVPIAGKTGTAETGGSLGDHAWFAGYVPADDPQFAFVVVLEHGGSGGRAAGGPAREIAKSLLDLGLISSE